MTKIQYIVFVIALSFIIGESKKYRLTSTQNQKIRQARTLQNNGLNKQAKEIYYDLFIENPYLKELDQNFRQPLMKICIEFKQYVRQ